MKTIVLQIFFLLKICFSIVYGQGLTTVSEIYDGTPRDIAAGNGVLYLAQGRQLALIDPSNGLRIGNHTAQPYLEQLAAVEFDTASNMLFVATVKKIFIYDLTNSSTKIWENQGASSILDFKLITADSKIVAVFSDTIKLIDYSPVLPNVVSFFTVPTGISFFQKIHIANTRNGYMAYISGAITANLARGVYGLVIANLNSKNNYASPTVYPTFWNPVTHYSSLGASVLNVQVAENYNGQFTYAFVACGTAGQLTVLDVTNPSAISFVMKKDLLPGHQVFKVFLDQGNRRIFAASANNFHILDMQNGNILGSVNTGFYDAGDRDMALINHNSNSFVWTATHEGVGYVLNSVNVTTNQPVHTIKQWWISSSDGGVAVPEWNSVYLPTFGGIVRYDISDIQNPVAVNASYRPANGIVEHIEVIFPNANDPDNALLLTAMGSGGFRVFPVSKANPNPGIPQIFAKKPVQWGNDPVYQNDVAFFQKNGINYYLADLSNRQTHEIALQIYNTSTGNWLNVIEQSEELTSNSKTVRVWGNYAFVTCTGGFFVVDLSNLPHTASITDVVLNDWNHDGKPDDVACLVVSDDGQHIFISHRPNVIQSYQFNATNGLVTGPLDILSGPTISGSTSPGGSYYAPLKRLYIPGDGGTIMEIDVADPSNLSLISSWNNGGYFGEMQDCKIYDFGNVPHLLAIKNNEAFAIVKIENGISNNLIAHWTFDSDDNNNVFDVTSNAFHGKGNNIHYEDGPISKAVVFNGTDSRIDFPEMGAIPPAKIGNLDFGSISLWFKFQNQGGDILPLFYFGENDPSLPHNSLIIEIGHNQDIGDRRLYFTIIVAPYNVTRFCFDTGFNLQENTWYHFAAVVNNEGNTGYLNGVELSGRRYNLNSNESYTDFFSHVTAKKQLSLGFGRYGRNSSFFSFKGSLDDVRIYGRALTGAEVKALYSLGNITSTADNTFQYEKNLNVKNYPNPFNHSTTISWQSKVSGHTTLMIYNIMGRKIKTLVNEYRYQGNYNMVFDGMDLPAGVYYGKLQVGNNQSTVKMMIMK
jgi:hypothetical protein